MNRRLHGRVKHPRPEHCSSTPNYAYRTPVRSTARASRSPKFYLRRGIPEREKRKTPWSILRSVAYPRAPHCIGGIGTLLSTQDTNRDGHMKCDTGLHPKGSASIAPHWRPRLGPRTSYVIQEVDLSSLSNREVFTSDSSLSKTQEEPVVFSSLGFSPTK